MVRTRVITGVVGIAVALLAVWLGGVVFVIALTVATLLALNEILGLLDLAERQVNRGLTMIAGLALPATAYYHGVSGVLAVTVVFALTLWLWKIVRHPRVGFEAAGLNLFSLVYVPLSLSYLALIYRLAGGWLLVVYVLLATWVADSVAYIVGNWAGKRPLASGISPNKTVEGALAAIVANLAVFGLVIRWPTGFLLNQRLAFAATAAVAAILGDLAESAFKREFGLKDSGVFFPGHGGVLDRLDSLLFTSITSYYLFTGFGV